MNSMMNEALRVSYGIISMFAIFGLFWIVLDVLGIVDISRQSTMALLFGFYFAFILAMALMSWYSLGMDGGNEKGDV